MTSPEQKARQSIDRQLGETGWLVHDYRAIYLLYTNGLNPDPRSREVFTFHRPEELIRLAALESQLRANIRQMPELLTERVWDVQIDAVRNLEQSLAANRPRALIQMAMGED